MKPNELAGHWERRWIAVNTLTKIPGATEAVPLLESMLQEKNTKPWVSIHVPRALNVQGKTDVAMENEATADPTATK